MQLHFHPTVVVFAALIGAVSGAAVADTTSTSQIYQQRDADGRAVLTDRPSAQSVTERTWQVSREDPAAARQRALEVKREADAVSERVQRSIEAQLRRSAEEDLMRMRLAMLERQQPSAAYDDGSDAVAFIPVGYRRRVNRLPPSSMPARGGSFRGSASLGSR
jgi:hypothetical protein